MKANASLTSKLEELAVVTRRSRQKPIGIQFEAASFRPPVTDETLECRIALAARLLSIENASVTKIAQSGTSVHS